MAHTSTSESDCQKSLKNAENSFEHPILALGSFTLISPSVNVWLFVSTLGPSAHSFDSKLRVKMEQRKELMR